MTQYKPSVPIYDPSQPPPLPPPKKDWLHSETAEFMKKIVAFIIIGTGIIVVLTQDF